MSLQRDSNCALTSSILFFSSSVSSSFSPSLVQHTSFLPSYSLSCCTKEGLKLEETEEEKNKM